MRNRSNKMRNRASKRRNRASKRRNRASKRRRGGLPQDIDLYNISKCKLSNEYIKGFDKDFNCKPVKPKTMKITRSNTRSNTKPTSRFTIKKKTNVKKPRSIKSQPSSYFDKYRSKDELTTRYANTTLERHSPSNVKQEKGDPNKI
jgi:hypothetical protein